MIKKVFTSAFINIICKMSRMSKYTYKPTLRPDGMWDQIKVPTMNHFGDYNYAQLAALGLGIGFQTSTLQCLAGWSFKVEQIQYPFSREHPGYKWFRVTTQIQGA